MTQAKINRKHEKKMKENLIMLDDERRHADQYKEQAEKVNTSYFKRPSMTSRSGEDYGLSQHTS